MELRTTRAMRRNEQLSKLTPKKADSAKTQASKPQEPTDKFSLSRQALTYVDEQDRKMWNWQQEREQRRQNRMADSLSALDSTKSELDLLSKSMDVMDKCLKIAASIMKGNKVPPEDLQYLMKNDPDGYRMALALRKENPDPKDEKSVLDEEDRDGGSADSAGGGESPAVSAPETSGGSAVE